MKETRYFKLALAMPLFVPGVAQILHGLGVEDPTPTTGLLVLSLVVGGIPYAVCASVALVWLHGRTAAEHRRLALLGPILFVPFLATWIYLSESLGRISWEFSEFLALLGTSAVLAVVYGYSYVALVLLIRHAVVTPVGQSHV